MRVVSVDIGIFHLGVVDAEVYSNYELNEIRSIALVNIKELCVNCPGCSCRHSLCFIDYLDHLYREFPCFDEADEIIIERQPPGGFIVIQELIMNRYRDKTILISPTSVHKHFSIGHLDYEGRKVESTATATAVLGRPIPYERKHDIADAVCQLLFHLARNHTKVPSIESFAYCNTSALDKFCFKA